MEIKFPQHHFVKETILPLCVFLVPILEINWPYTRGFIFGLSIPFYWSMWLFYACTMLCYMLFWLLSLCNIIYNLIWIYVAFSFVLLKIALAILGLLWLHMNFRILFFYICKEWIWDFGKNFIESVDLLGVVWPFY